jgi:uncharacterized C2H2 Zn-finger protein
MESKCIELIDRRIILPIDFLDRKYKYNLEFSFKTISENKKKGTNFTCPFCNKVYTTMKSLVGHVKRVHMVNYDLLENWVSCSQQDSPESKKYVSTLSPELICFRMNLLNILEKMESLSMSMINLGKEYISQIDVNDSGFLREYYMMGRSIIILSYIRVYYTAILTSSQFTEDIYRYLFLKNEGTEREQHSKAEGICQICNLKVAIDKHHLIPLVYGGSNDIYNLINVCKECHDMDMFEVVFKLFRDNEQARESLLKNFKVN